MQIYASRSYQYLVLSLLAVSTLLRYSFEGFLPVSIHLQQQILQEKLRQDLEVVEGIFDRSILDHYAYILYWCTQNLTDSVVRGLEEVVRNGLIRYDALVYFPMPHWTPDEDEMREGGLAKRRVMDAIIRGLLVSLGREYITMGQGSAQERAQGLHKLLVEVS